MEGGGGEEGVGGENEVKDRRSSRVFLGSAYSLTAIFDFRKK